MGALLLTLTFLSAPPVEPLYMATAQAQETGVMDVERARRVFSGRLTRWPDGTKIRLVLPPRGSAAMKRLCALVRMPESTYRHFLHARAFARRMPKVIEADSEAEVATQLGAVRGAVAPMLEPPRQPGVRLVRVPQ